MSVVTCDVNMLIFLRANLEVNLTYNALSHGMKLVSHKQLLHDNVDN